MEKKSMLWNDVARVVDLAQGSAVDRYILGLNIFLVNLDAGELPMKEDPRLIYLGQLLRDRTPVVIVSALAIQGDDIRNVFHGSSLSFFPTPVDLFKGSIFFGNGTMVTSFSYEVFEQNLDSVDEMLNYDGIAFCFSEDNAGFLEYIQNVPEPDLSPGDRREALNAQSRALVEDLVSHCDVLVTSSSDGWSINLLARDASKFESFMSPIDVAVQSIEANAWYQANSSDLWWDEESPEQCLERRPEKREP